MTDSERERPALSLRSRSRSSHSSFSLSCLFSTAMGADTSLGPPRLKQPKDADSVCCCFASTAARRRPGHRRRSPPPSPTPFVTDTTRPACSAPANSGAGPSPRDCGGRWRQPAPGAAWLTPPLAQHTPTGTRSPASLLSSPHTGPDRPGSVAARHAAVHQLRRKRVDVWCVVCWRERGGPTRGQCRSLRLPTHARPARRPRSRSARHKIWTTCARARCGTGSGGMRANRHD